MCDTTIERRQQIWGKMLKFTRKFVILSFWGPFKWWLTSKTVDYVVPLLKKICKIMNLKYYCFCF